MNNLDYSKIQKACNKVFNAHYKRLKFIIEKTEYKINTEKQIVTCLITGKIDGVDGRYYDEAIARCTTNNNIFYGIAKCSSNDEWDETLGKRIAESKAKINIYKSLFKLSKILSTFYKNKKNKMFDGLEKYQWLIKREMAHVDKLKNSVKTK